jgi:hypothetical protein
MSNELERELRRVLGRPSSSDDAREHARRVALAAVSERRQGRRGRTVLLAAAATVAAMFVAAGALAAAGALHVSLGSDGQTPRSAPEAAPRLAVPPGADGIAAVVDGRLWLATRQGTRIEGLPVSTAELSPHALYVGAGLGRSLVAMSPNGRRAWAHAASGRVAAISWAPNGLQIAYIVHDGSHFELRLIEGDGDHDRLLDRAVRPVRPSWRADSLSLAYVGAGGMPVVYDFGHDSRVPLRLGGFAHAVAYAPAGHDLAITSRDRLWLLGDRQRPRPLAHYDETPTDVAWVGRSVAVASSGSRGRRPRLTLLRPSRTGTTARELSVGAPVLAVAASPRGVVIATRGVVRLLATAKPGAPRDGIARQLLALPRRAVVGYLIVR